MVFTLGKQRTAENDALAYYYPHSVIASCALDYSVHFHDLGYHPGSCHVYDYISLLRKMRRTLKPLFPA
jgi:hypothetical protein